MTTRNRWWIAGSLVTRANLRIGTGDYVADDTRVDVKNGEPAKVGAIATDHNGKPWLPGASLRGALRAWCGKHAPQHVDTLFGRGDKDQESAGRITVFGGAFRDQDIAEKLTAETTHYRADRHTLLEAGVAIDRVHGVASEGKLYHHEIVPPGVCFDLRIEARDVEDAAIQTLLAALNAFNDDSLVLGAEGHDGKGRMAWYCEQVRRLDGDALVQWARDALAGKAGAPVERARPVAIQANAPTTPPSGLDITLTFEGLFCVDDKGRADWAKERKKETQSQEPRWAAKQPRLDGQGRAYLPAKSFRGVLRGQMERIARTLGIAHVCGEGAGPACAPIHGVGEVGTLCPVCQLMGAPGWKSLLDIDDFRQQGEAQLMTQEFLAIDRFTGGGADGLKFNARALVRPTLRGRLNLDEARLVHLKDRTTALDLLALTLRDLKEGDLRFGMGAAKGYGACKAEYAIATGQARACLDDVLDAVTAWSRPDPNRPPAAEVVPETLPNAAREFTPPPTPQPPGQETFHNPYHFIPVAKPDTATWQTRADFPGQAGHAVYRNRTADGKPVYSGRILCRLTAETPFFVGGSRTREASDAEPAQVDGFALDGQPAIPASSLRGLISSLVEAATGSSLRVLEDAVLSYRREVGEGLSAIGMLKKSESPEREFDLIPMTIPSLRTSVGRDFELPRKWHAVFKDAPLKESLVVHVDGYQSVVESDGQHDHLAKRNDSFLGRVDPDSFRATKSKFFFAQLQTVSSTADRPIPTTEAMKIKQAGDSQFLLGQRLAQAENPLLSETEWDALEDPKEKARYTKGVLHVLGLGDDECRKNDMPSTKKHELFLPKSGRARLPVSDLALERFRALGQERAEAGAEPYALKGYPDWRPRSGDLVYFDVELDAGKPVVSEISVSAIWRDRVEETVTDDKGAKTTRPANVRRFFEHLSAELLPFNGKRQFISPAESMFGFSSGDKAEADKDWLAFRGRVQPGDGVCVKHPERLPEVTLKILDTPKPPSPNLYFKVGDHGIKKSNLSPGSHRPQGHKQYLHHQVADRAEPWKTAKGPGDKFKQHVAIRPLKKEAEFLFHFDFENLSEWELSALCYALRPGDGYRHKLGMGKPLGLGTVRIDPEGLFLIDRPQRYRQPDARYPLVWLAHGHAPKDWQAHYPLEAACPPTGPAPAFPTLRDRFRAGMAAEVRRALDLLGNPGFTAAPVHYPLEQGQTNPESEHFKWFVNNEKWAARDAKTKNAQNRESQALTPLTAAATKLPTLRKNRRP